MLSGGQRFDEPDGAHGVELTTAAGKFNCLTGIIRDVTF
jgi:hypothetical protein